MIRKTALVLLALCLFSIPVVAQSVTELIAQLSHPNPDVRGRAVDRLGELRDSRAVEPILQRLDGADRSLQFGCIAALEKLQDIRAIPRLIQLLEKTTDYSTSFSIARALASMGPGGVDFLVEALRSPSGPVRESLAFALGRMKDQRAVAPLAALLSDPSFAVRAKAATALGEIGDKRSTESLRQAMADDSPEVRAAVVKALGNLHDTDAIPLIIGRLKEDVQTVRSAAIDSLGEMASPDALTPLIEALSDSNRYVRGAAARHLGKFNDPRAVKGLIGILSDSAMTVRMDAASSLGKIADPAAMAFLVKIVETDSEALVRREAAKSLAAFGPKGVEWFTSATGSKRPEIRAAAALGLGLTGDARSVSLIAPLIKDSDSVVRENAIDALVQLKQPEGIPLLLTALTDEDEYLRNTAGTAISKFGKDAIPQLVQALHGDEQIRQIAVRALASMGSTAVKLVVDVLKDPQSDIRVSAAEALYIAALSGQIDAAAREQMLLALHDTDSRVRVNIINALNFLSKADFTAQFMDRLHDPVASVREAAIQALLQAAVPPPVTVFIEALGDSDNQVRQSAAEGVARLGDAGAIEPLTQALKDEDPKVRYWGANGLGKVGGRAIGPLINALANDPDWGVRAEAARALAAMRASDAIPALLSNLTSKQWNFADTVAEALQAIGSPAVPELIKALQNDDPDVRELAAESLGSIGDPSAVNALIARLSDESGFVRTAAAGALGRIGEAAAQPLLSAARQNVDARLREAALWALRFLEGGPSGNLLRDGIVDADEARNRLRNYFRSSSLSGTYSKLVAICDAALCLEKYTWPSFPPFGFPAPSDKSAPAVSRMIIDGNGRVHQFDVNGNPIPSADENVRTFEATLQIEASGRVSSVVWNDSTLAPTEIETVLRTWKFDTFKPGTAFPIAQRIKLQFSTEGRPRYRYGRPSAEFGIDHVNITTHMGLPHIN